MPLETRVNVNDDIIKYLVGQGLLNAAGGVLATIKAKTAAYTVDPDVDPSGTVFTNRGAGGSVTFTLPDVVPSMAGLHYRFVGIANQNIVVATDTADTLVTLNDAAADSVAISTTAQKIGGVMDAYCDGTAWVVVGSAVGHTYTVVTA